MLLVSFLISNQAHQLINKETHQNGTNHDEQFSWNVEHLQKTIWTFLGKTSLKYDTLYHNQDLDQVIGDDKACKIFDWGKLRLKQLL